MTNDVLFPGSLPDRGAATSVTRKGTSRIDYCWDAGLSFGRTDAPLVPARQRRVVTKHWPLMRLMQPFHQSCDGWLWPFPTAHTAESPSRRPAIDRIKLFVASRPANDNGARHIIAKSCRRTRRIVPNVAIVNTCGAKNIPNTWPRTGARTSGRYRKCDRTRDLQPNLIVFWSV